MNKQLENNRDISLTNDAAIRLKEIQKKTNKETWGLSFSLKQGLCGSGYEYILDLMPNPQLEDQTLYSQGIPIYVSKENMSKLEGSQITFQHLADDTNEEEGLEKFGFKVLNPNVKGPCPCQCNKGFDL
jgi:Fe-S cluster assembly protein SufA